MAKKQPLQKGTRLPIYEKNDPKTIYEDRNTDNIFSRNVIAGIINTLNQKVFYKQIWDGGKEEIIHVPFFFNMGQSGERFVQDNYTFLKDLCEFPSKMDGSFDIIPRGVIKLNSSTIESSSITNRFVMGEYTKKDENGVYQTYASFVYSIPIRMEFEVEIIFDTTITMFKVEQAIRESLYKNIRFSFLYNGVQIRSTLGISESLNGNKQIEYKVGTQQEQPKATFGISVETYQPVFDKTAEMRADKTMKHLGYEVSFAMPSTMSPIGHKNLSDGSDYIPLSSSVTGGSIDGYIKPLTVFPSIVPSSGILEIQWLYDKFDGDMRTVMLSMIDMETGRSHVIAPSINKSYYDWNIKNSFSEFGIPLFDDSVFLIEIKNEEESPVLVESPNISITPDPKTQTITPQSFHVSGGQFLPSRDGRENSLVEIELSTINRKLITIPKNLKIFLNVTPYGTVDRMTPVVFRDGASIKYNEKVTHRNIELIIEDLENRSISVTIPNIVIV